MDEEEFSSEKNVKVIGIIIFLSTMTVKELYGSQQFPEKIQNLIFCLSTILNKSIDKMCHIFWRNRVLLSEVLRLRSQTIIGHTAPQPNS